MVIMGEVGTEEKFSRRKEYYARKVSEYLYKYPDNFEGFVGDQEIIRFGDKLLSERLTAGYNFATFEQFPINSKESLIFYGVYAQRTGHFGELLARMEEQKIITETDISFGVMGTKIIGYYKDEETVTKQIKMNDGSSTRTMESVEGVIIFKPKDKNQAEDIATFLLKEAPRIKGGYAEPNTRATATPELKETLVSEDGFKLAIANVYRFSAGNIVALKRESKFEESKKGWESIESLLNPELFEYIAYLGVQP